MQLHHGATEPQSHGATEDTEDTEKNSWNHRWAQMYFALSVFICARPW